MKKRFKTLKDLLLIIICIKVALASSKCGKDLLKIKAKPLDRISLNKKTKNNAETSSTLYQPIKIGFDFTNFFKPSKMSSSTFNKIKSLIIETAIEFKKFLQVSHEDIDLTGAEELIKDYCLVDNIASEYPYFLLDNDVIIFPAFNEEDLGEYTLAGATACITIKDTKRPIAGILYINPNLNFEKKNIELYMKNILLHEITHILVFSPDLLKNLNLIKSSGSTYYVNSPKVLEKAREHFGCNSLSGVYLENQGGEGSVGSHWESRYMLGDYMISTDYPETVLSDITLALFEDSGLYKVNYFSGNLFKFGKNKGCDFVNKSKKCIENSKATFDEFCVETGEPKCTSSRTIKSSCFIREYTKGTIPSNYQYFTNPNIGGFEAADFCPIAFDFSSNEDFFDMSCKVGQSNGNTYGYGETFGDNSFCFISSLSPETSSTNYEKDTICHQVNCDSDNKNIIIKIDSNEIKCPTEGGTINNPSGFKGSIECPKYEEICSNNSDDILSNEMFDTLTKEAEKNNYRYSTNIVSYDESEYIDFYIRNNDKNYINFNSGVLLILLILGIIY